jgi:hypothetical protein
MSNKGSRSDLAKLWSLYEIKRLLVSVESAEEWHKPKGNHFILNEHGFSLESGEFEVDYDPPDDEHTEGLITIWPKDSMGSAIEAKLDGAQFTEFQKNPDSTTITII